MKMKLNEDCDICVDCLMYLVNGDEPHDDDTRYPFDGTGNNTEWFSFSLKDSEPFFSHRPCDNCSRPLGGNRYNGDLISYKGEQNEN